MYYYNTYLYVYLLLPIDTYKQELRLNYTFFLFFLRMHDAFPQIRHAWGMHDEFVEMRPPGESEG